MPTYYDEKTKTWFCQFRYTDSNGNKKQKRKRKIEYIDKTKVSLIVLI